MAVGDVTTGAGLGAYQVSFNHPNAGNTHFPFTDNAAYISYDSTKTLVLRTYDGTSFVTVATFTAERGLTMPELASDASAPAANNGTLYLKDNGAGKTQLAVRFATGAVQILATEP